MSLVPNVALAPSSATPGARTEGTSLLEMSSGDDARMAARNGLQLGSSLIATWVIGLTLTNIALPHLATPVQLGVLGFCEAVASIILAVPTFGLDTYIRTEVARHAEAARTFVMGTLVVRMIVSALFIVAALGVLRALGRNASTLEVLLWFGLATFMAQSAEINAALLQAVGKVRGQAQINILAKVTWATIAVVGLRAGIGIRAVPMALLASESIKALYLGWKSHRILHIPLSLRHQRVTPVLAASLPFLATALAIRVMMWLDVTLMGVILTGDRGEEAVGLYFSAVRLAQLAQILAPVAVWVLMPLASRAYARSRQEYQQLMHRSFQTGLCIVVALTTLLALNADVVIATLQPDSYLPASRALRVLACMFLLTCLNMLASTFLQIQGEGWVVVRSTVVTIVVDLALVLALVPLAHRSWGVGGAGLAASMALITAEAFAAVILMRRLGRGSFDRRAVSAIAVAVYGALCVVAIDRVAAWAGLFMWRTVLDVVCMAVLVWMLRIYDLPPSLRNRIPFLR